MSLSSAGNTRIHIQLVWGNGKTIFEVYKEGWLFSYQDFKSFPDNMSSAILKSLLTEIKNLRVQKLIHNNVMSLIYG